MKIVIYTLGCKVNQYESDALTLALEQQGHTVSQNLEEADVYLLNTCAVTSESERKSRQLVARALKFNENAKVIVMGCASENNAKQFLEKEKVTLALGVAGKHLIPQLLEELGDHVKPLPKEYENNFEVKPLEIRSTLKVQDGCNNYCAYCLIPYLRGDSRSRDLESILKEANTLAKYSKEIVVTGINTSDYKINGELALPRLMRALGSVEARIRISSLEVNVITKELLEALSKMPNFAPHFHLSMQSGCTKTLKDMNRKYTIKEYLQKVKLIRKYFKNPSITTDLIVGFPTETEKDFNETLKTIKKAKFYDMHIFPYSKRNGTKAETLQELPSSVIKERLKKARELKKQGYDAYRNKSLGTMQTVLIEKEHEGLLQGYTEHYIKVFLAPQKGIEVGEFYNVTLISIFKDGVIGQYN